MIRKGMRLSRAPHLTFRYVTEADLERCTEPREWSTTLQGYCVIVPVKKCLDGEGAFDHELRKAAQCLKFSGWSRTNMVCGAGWRKQTRGARFWVSLSELSVEEQASWRKEDPENIRWNGDKTDGTVPHWFDTYWTSTTYWVEDAQVWVATGRTYKDPTS